jgi:iron(III) transport system substrate-binding protein
MQTRTITLFLAFLLMVTGLAACGSDGADLTIYSGRSSELVEDLLEQFADERGIDIDVLYGDTAEVAAKIAEEGDRSPADVFFSQDAGALGALADEGLLAELPDSVLDLVPAAFRSRQGVWVGTSGRARTLVYNPEAVSDDELPASVFDLVDPKWQGRIAWAPTNGSFQAFVTGLRALEGDDAARQWLEGMIANGTEEFESNTPIVQAVGSGEIDAGLVNHYYLPQLRSENPGLSARNHFFGGGDPGGLINVAGVAVLESSDHSELALELIEFLLSAVAQEYFAAETFEYPLVDAVEADPDLPELTALEPPDVDLSKLEDLRGTLDLLREVGAL